MITAFSSKTYANTHGEREEIVLCNHIWVAIKPASRITHLICKSNDLFHTKLNANKFRMTSHSDQISTLFIRILHHHTNVRSNRRIITVIMH